MKYVVALFFSLIFAPLICHASNNEAVLEEVNLARSRPHEYAASLEARMGEVPGVDERCVREAAAFLRRQRPVGALQSCQGLTMSAREHVAEKGETGETGHRSANGESPFTRMGRWGQWTGRAGENISYGYEDARMIVMTLIVDQGVRDRGHRRNIFYRYFKVGGAACGPHARYGTMCVIDFAEGFVEKGDKVVMAEGWRGAGE